MTYTVDVRGLRKSFDGRVVLDGVDLAVPDRTILALLGPNGAGKSTLVRILSTLLRPDGGTATIAGHDLVGEPFAVRSRISLTGQRVAVDDILTGRENLRLSARLRHLPRRTALARVEELLETFDLTSAADRRAATYSGGMQRRLDLALSLVVPPRVLFLDEPTTGLDPRGRERLWDVVRGLVDQGVTIMLTTQYLEEADQLADRIAVLDGGRVVATGTPQELKSSVGVERVRLQFDCEQAVRRAAGVLGERQVVRDELALGVATTGSADEVLALLSRLERAGVPARSVSTHRPSLDDVYLSLTKEPAA